MSSELEPTADAPPVYTPVPIEGTGGAVEPAKKSFGELIFGILNFLTLSARFMALAAAAMWLKENLHLIKAHMHRNAEFARRVAEMCEAAGADGRFIAEILEASAAIERVAQASGVLADAADQMEMNARFVNDAHESEYRGIYEVRQASPYAQPKPGFNAVR